MTFGELFEEFEVGWWESEVADVVESRVELEGTFNEGVAAPSYFCMLFQHQNWTTWNDLKLD